ncbi:pleiotropic regulator 1 [Diaphorina citri]|uniref:Pleiotropic regulator 1 n=1 Tax=Diaphorina citri TaxID=121845 RepID=A0A3Q0ISS4_DIACI|nr:pleiotropic regulator 1 [Diaphorina citri]
MTEEVQRHSVHTLVFRSLKRTHDMFISCQGLLPPVDETAEKIRQAIKARDTYGSVLHKVQQNKAKEIHHNKDHSTSASETSQELVPSTENQLVPTTASNTQIIQQAKAKALPMPKPQWHAPWKLYRVISGHLGWVRCVAVEPGNEWFATGSADKIIKVWDLATGKLKLSLTGHVGSVRGLTVSPRHPYLFSCGDDRTVKCWDLEYNKAPVQPGSMDSESGIFSMTFDNSGSRLITTEADKTVKLYKEDDSATEESHPVITGSHDCTIRLWDLAAGKSLCTLTNHKKSVRSVALHPTLYMFASASPDNIKQWKCPEGKFIQNLPGHNAIINSICVNNEGVLVSGADNGTMCFWDWRTGYNFQRLQVRCVSGFPKPKTKHTIMCYES